MNAVNLTLRDVVLGDERTLPAAESLPIDTVTDHDKMLARAGTIAIVDARGRRRNFDDDEPQLTEEAAAEREQTEAAVQAEQSGEGE